MGYIEELRAIIGHRRIILNDYTRLFEVGGKP